MTDQLSFADRARVEQLWDLVAEFRFGVERLKIEHQRLGTAWGISQDHEKVQTAIRRGEKDMEILIWAINRITGTEAAPTDIEDVEARIHRRMLILD